MSTLIISGDTSASPPSDLLKIISHLPVLDPCSLMQLGTATSFSDTRGSYTALRLPCHRSTAALPLLHSVQLSLSGQPPSSSSSVTVSTSDPTPFPHLIRLICTIFISPCLPPPQHFHYSGLLYCHHALPPRGALSHHGYFGACLRAEIACKRSKRNQPKLRLKARKACSRLIYSQKLCS